MCHTSVCFILCCCRCHMHHRETTTENFSLFLKSINDTRKNILTAIITIWVIITSNTTTATKKYFQLSSTLVICHTVFFFYSLCTRDLSKAQRQKATNINSGTRALGGFQTAVFVRLSNFKAHSLACHVKFCWVRYFKLAVIEIVIFVAHIRNENL